MITEIEEHKNASQCSGTRPNLGGPTSISLAEQKPGINSELRAWADRYIDLNGGLTS